MVAETPDRAPAKLPEGWRMVTFGEMAQSITDRVDNPAEAGVERYIGLEHLDPATLHIHRWGLPTDVEATKLRFQPGDVVFGRRRAYQRKLAVADFEGICSAHALVLRPRTEIVASGYLPVFMQSEVFFKRALEISVGSLSPTINWKTLAVQRFPLPPMGEQERIAEILWAADSAVECWSDSKVRLNSLFELSLNQNMRNTGVADPGARRFPAHWKVVRLSDVADVDRGKFSFRPRNLPQFYGGPYPFVQTGDVASAGPRLSDSTQTLSEEGRSLSRSFPPSSILITIAAIIGSTTITETEVYCPDSVVGIIPKTGMRVEFLEYYLRTCQPFLDQKAATQTAQKNINLEKLRPLAVPLPPEDEQNEIVQSLRTLETGLHEVEIHRRHLLDVRSTAVNTLLEGRLGV